MPRTKTIPDADIFACILLSLSEGGDKAVSFASIAHITGLAAPTLVQRFGSRQAMVCAAVEDMWNRMDAALNHAGASAAISAKGVPALLKLLAESSLPDPILLAFCERTPDLRDRATDWRAGVEAALALRLGGNIRARETAALMFAAWQGQYFWQPAGGKAFRLKDALKRLTA